MARDAGGTYDDIEGLINEPLTVKNLAAVVFFKQSEGNEYRVSMRSKGTIDIGAVAKQFGGGGHKNAAGCTATGSIDELQRLFIEKMSARDRRRDGLICESPRPCNPSIRNRWSWHHPLDGLLVVDKPVGPTSHDVVVARSAHARGETHRPHRHARPSRQRRARARGRPRDPARAVHGRRREAVRGARAARRRDRHLRRPRHDGGRAVPGTMADT